MDQLELLAIPNTKTLMEVFEFRTKDVHSIPRRANFPSGRRHNLLKIQVIHPSKDKFEGIRPTKPLTLVGNKHMAMITSNPRQGAARHSTPET